MKKIKQYVELMEKAGIKNVPLDKVQKELFDDYKFLEK